jgi:hypothetical protein
VIAPASTGSDNKRRTAVTKTDQINRGKLSNLMKLEPMFKIVEIKLIAPKIEEIPAKCKLKIAESTEKPEWNNIFDKGGYTVQPVPTPTPQNDENKSRKREGGRSQKLMLFMRGNAISWEPTIIGISQLPNPPIIIGITVKKIITKAWEVTKTLYTWSLPTIEPNPPNSNRIIDLNEVPNKPAQPPKIKYKLPMSLW